MPTPKDDPQPKQRTAARSWGRVQSIDKQISKLTSERAEIVKELESILKPQ
jgi:hypothetical protein